MATAEFDLEALLRATDDERQRQGLTWSALSGRLGVSASTIRRFGTAHDAEADGVLAVARWLGVAPEAFVEGGTVPGRQLPREANRFVRVDMDAVGEASGETGGRRRSRTTIQRLVGVAEDAGRPVASLIRLSDT